LGGSWILPPFLNERNQDEKALDGSLGNRFTGDGFDDC
jgi:hypothetical protein